ncbi:Gamma carbonic anhydrase-like 1, mitochondrial [Apostasia shenzhenica]|uniref:Gamma carbonic anhydrase-like 1, mitochondrial n=1 Tax=Apostasia shenzhenica TaxID=1088818 RepID=A0A2I0AQK1_9ASPA|nr:Gamma carbonic anhydrase-like 1, mitochondrial [Apostasia shenzhenica]
MAAALARLSRRALGSYPVTCQTPRRLLSAEAVAVPASPPSSSVVAPSSDDRVKWDYRGQRQIIPLGQWVPKVAVDAYVAPNVILAGQVTVCDGASVWYGSVLRGDLNKITVGFCSSVQERCVLHAAWSSPTVLSENLRKLVISIRLSFIEYKFSIRLGLPAETFVERYVTIGAFSLLRSCTIEPECIIGQHSILMEGSLVETNSILEAGSVLPPGRRIPTGELWAGNPARFVRKLSYDEIKEIPELAVAINDLMQSHRSEFLPYSTVYLEAEKMKNSLGIPI